MAKSCPVNFEKVDENKVRFQALLVALSTLAFIMSGWVFFAFLLLYDFSARLFISQKISPFAQLAIVIIKLFNIRESLVDSAPKVFASYIGFVFSIIILLASLFEAESISAVFAIILAICAAMDAVFNYCVGCKVYTVLHRFNIV